MFKRINTLTFLLLITQSLIAQNNGFIVKDYYPAMTFTNGFRYGEQKIPLSFKNDGDCDLAFARYQDNRTKYWELFAERCIYGEQKSIKFVGKYGINTSSIPDNFWRGSNLFFSDLDEIVYIAYREKNKR